MGDVKWRSDYKVALETGSKIHHPNSPIMHFDSSPAQSPAHLKCPIYFRRSKMSMKIAILSKNIRLRLQSSYTVNVSFINNCFGS